MDEDYKTVDFSKSKTIDHVYGINNRRVIIFEEIDCTKLCHRSQSG